MAIARERKRGSDEWALVAPPLRLLLLLCVGATLALAQDRPDNIDEMLTQFNLDQAKENKNKTGVEEEVDDYGIKQYEKSKTQFDGVTSEMQVSYLQLGRTHGVEIPVLSTGTRNVNTDFTVMLWFKIDATYSMSPVSDTKEDENEQKVDEIEVNPDVQIMYLFSFADSAACFFTDSLTLMCDSWDRRKLQVSANLILPGIWYHLTLSSSADADSFLLIQSHDKIVAVDSTTNFGFRQNTMYGWKACLGDCTSNYGFIGAVREVVMFDRAVTQDQAVRAKNLILTYNSSIKAYFRFHDSHNKFEKDEFVDWPWLKFKNQPEDPQAYIGTDIIPNDVCPSLFFQVSALRFNEETLVQTVEFENQLNQNKYAYTMSMTLMLNETACTATTPSEAAQDCNLMLLDGVFMFYMMGRNTARFHFFASKNYYESASKIIYLPYDQWITVQLSIDQYDGYAIVVSDQNGNAFYRTRVQQNMQEQWPSNQLSLFRAFNGYVEHFYLIDSYKVLNPYYATNFRGDVDAMVNIQFLQENYDEELDKILSRGRLDSVFISPDPVFESVFFQQPSEGGNVAGTLEDENHVFDGIACNDRHMTTQLADPESYIQFMTPTLKDWSKANTVEFWFKVQDSALYEQSVMLFSMVSNENSNPAPYYHIYIDQGALKCAPFGTRSYKDPVIVFTDFNKENEDIYGWWHVSCSYAFQQTAKGTLFNTQVLQVLEETMVGLPKFYPTNSLMATFGKQAAYEELLGPAGVLVKEFRFWNKQQSMGELANNRYRQIDPTKLQATDILVYLRLATGSSLIENFAKQSQGYRPYQFKLRTSGLTFAEDFIETERYNYDRELDLVVSRKMRTYHTVCPVHTYYMNQFCYNEPVNQVVLGIFPQWNEDAGRIDWFFTIAYSSVINQDVMKFLSEAFRSDDLILNSYLAKDMSKQKLDHLIPSSILRHESTYSVSAALTNEELTFFKEKTVKFVPSKCKWLSVVGSGVTESYTIFEVSPATQDISFQLELKRNAQLDCSQFDFFDTFVGLNFEFTMTDTAEYISYIPKMEVVAFNPETGNVIGMGDATPTRMLVNVTMPMQEQQRLPVFKDVMVMMSVHWTSSRSQDLELTENMLFQNILYMFKFEPIANVLFADLVASQEAVIRGETLILDASNSYISNMPIMMQRRSLAYDWNCPETFEEYCEKQAGDQLAIPFDVAKENKVDFEEPYVFEVTVIWAKPDGRDEKQTMNVTVTWYNLSAPKFSIDFDKQQTLITSDQNSLFYLEANNFAIDNIYSYDVEWTLEPELDSPDNRSVLSGGRVMQIIKGSFAENTEYTVTLTVTSKKLDKLTNTKKVKFETLAPPVGGSVQVNPLQGYVGETFTIILNDWTSANLPIEYNVYTTFDQAGSRKGLLVNDDGPVPVNEPFQFKATRTTPIIVSVFDASGETLEYTLNPQISLPPDPKDDEKDGDSEGGSGDNEDNSTDDSEEIDDTPSPQSLLVKISNTESLRQRVNYMNVAIKTVQRLDPESSGTPQEQQINFRKQLINELQKQVQEFYARDKTDPLYMTPRDFLAESFQMLAELTAQNQYLDQDIVDKCTQVIYRLTQLDENMFYLVLESDSLVFRLNYFATLENLNRFARVNTVEWTLMWVRHNLKTTLNQMCTWVELPEVYEYSTNKKEFAFALFKFDKTTALKASRGTLSVLDAEHEYNAFTMYNWFTASLPGELCTQAIAQQFGTVNMDGAYIGNSQGRFSVSLYEAGTSTTHKMGELSGHTIATFQLDRDTYHSNQTVCMAFEEQEKRWKSDLCQSELSVDDVQMRCECNSFSSELIGIFTDFTRVLGAPVYFPAPPEPEVIEEPEPIEKQYVVPTQPIIDMSETRTSKVTEEDVVVAGTNYVWMGQTFMFSLLTLCGALVAYKMDKTDEQTQAVSRSGPIPVAKQNHFINEVANELKEPYASVYFRKQAVMYYRTIFSKSAFPHLMSQLHPLISPFTSFYATQSRLMRFSIYMLQFNIISAFVFVYYSSVYRKSDSERNASVVDQSDIISVISATLLCSLLMTPWLSEPLIRTCANQLVASANPNSANITQPVLIKNRRKNLRVVMQAISFASTLGLIVWASVASPSVPASSQYCMATTIIGSTFLATLCTNLLYLWANSCLARKVAYSVNKKKTSCCQCLVHVRAIQIVRDMKAVNEVKDQFTLSDVLPSSLECSERSMCSHHSGSVSRHHQSQSHNLSKHLAPIHEKTINAEEAVSEELIDDIEQRQTLEIARSPSEECKERQNTELNCVNSQRALNMHRSPNYEQMQEEQDESSKQNLIASMLKESIMDLDHSRNDVVPQRTQLESPRLQRIHPEGKVNINIDEEPGSSIEPSSRSDSFVTDPMHRSKLHRGPAGVRSQLEDSDSFSEKEDDIARQVNAGKHRIRSAATNSDIPLTLHPKVILQ